MPIPSLKSWGRTGEARPVEKKAAPAPATVQDPLELPNICFLGANGESGSATAVVIHTGNRTCFGSLAVSITSLIIVAAGAWLTVSPLANTLGFVPLPPLYWPYLAAKLLAYAVLTQLVKTWFIRKFGE